MVGDYLLRRQACFDPCGRAACDVDDVVPPARLLEVLRRLCGAAAGVADEVNVAVWADLADARYELAQREADSAGGVGVLVGLASVDKLCALRHVGDVDFLYGLQVDGAGVGYLAAHPGRFPAANVMEIAVWEMVPDCIADNGSLLVLKLCEPFMQVF